MKKTNLAMIILMALGVAACSSGGGSSNSDKSAQPAKPEAVKPAQPAKPEAEKPAQPAKPEAVKPAQPAKPEAVKPAQPAKPEAVKPAQPAKPEAVKPAQPAKPEAEKPAQPAKPEAVKPAQPAKPEAEKPAQPAKPETVKPTQPEKPTIERFTDALNVYEENKNYKGSGFSYPRKPGPIDVVGRTSPTAPLNYLKIDDYILDIFPDNFKSSSLKLTSNDIMRLAKKNANTLWAIIDDKSQDAVYIVVNGVNPSKGMASLKGTANYVGSGYHGYKVPTGHLLADSKVEMTADFDNKTVLGRISSPSNEFKEIGFGANIKDNSFQGKMNETLIEGGFFGDKAAEATAHYQNIKEKSFGVFGVKKQ